MSINDEFMLAKEMQMQRVAAPPRWIRPGMPDNIKAATPDQIRLAGSEALAFATYCVDYGHNKSLLVDVTAHFGPGEKESVTHHGLAIDYVTPPHPFRPGIKNADIVFTAHDGGELPLVILPYQPNPHRKNVIDYIEIPTTGSQEYYIMRDYLCYRNTLING